MKTKKGSYGTNLSRPRNVRMTFFLQNLFFKFRFIVIALVSLRNGRILKELLTFKVNL